MKIRNFINRFRNKKQKPSGFLIDFHCHSTLRAINTNASGYTKNMWDKTHNPHIDSTIGRWANYQTQEIAKHSQANFNAYKHANTRIIFDALYPVEKGWLEIRKLPAYLVGERARQDIMLVSFGIEKERLYKLERSNDYFSELEENYNFLTQNQGTSPNGKYHYRLAANFEEIEKSIGSDENLLLVIPTIEGAHALESGSPKSLKLPEEAHKHLLSQNIKSIKNWQYPPLYITIAHHFWNQLTGHARSMKLPINLMFNQNQGRDKGILNNGWHVIEELLHTSNGKRILIDCKHMSVKARLSYYEYTGQHNRQHPDDKIPAIFSHGGYNGYETMRDSIKIPDNGRKMRGRYFHNWSINISDEEANIIHDSGGLIGIMVDKSLLGSPDQLKYIKNIKNFEQRKELYIKLFLDNVFGIVAAINKPSALDVVVFGSDYDGMITHIDMYDEASKITHLKSDLLDYLQKYQYKQAYWFDYSPEEILNKFFSENVYNFLSKHYRKSTKNESFSAQNFS